MKKACHKYQRNEEFMKINKCYEGLLINDVLYCSIQQFPLDIATL